MNVTMSKAGVCAVVSVEGRIDTISAPDFEKQIIQLIDSGETTLVLDLAQLKYISSAGLRALLTAAKQAKACGGGLSCCAAVGVVRKVFDVSGFTSVLPVYDSLEAAMD